jgi:probable HAF family extracellular repeat protein
MKFTRRLWLGSAVGQLAWSLPGCGGKTSLKSPPPAPGSDSTRTNQSNGGSSRAVGSYQLVPLPGELQSPGYAAAINAAGQVAGQITTRQRRNHACLWDSSSVRDLDHPDGLWSGARAMNSQGQVVGESHDPKHHIRAILWIGTSIVELEYPGSSESHAQTINDAGQVAGYVRTRTGSAQAVLWDRDRKPIELKPLAPEFPQSQAVAMNRQGVVVGSSFNQKVQNPVIWKKGTVENLGTLGGTAAVAIGINDDAQVVGNSMINNGLHRHACLWSGGSVLDLHQLGTSSTAVGINGQGHVVGSYTTDKGEDRAFVWAAGTMHDLSGLLAVRGVVLRYPKMIDDRGWIVGVGDLKGVPVPFVARPVSS